MISKGAEFSEYLKQNYKCKPQGLLRRKLKYGVGLNDSDYITQPSIGDARVRCPAYSAWCEVIKRGYCSKYKAKYPTYEGVIVCDDWLVFSNFREWFIQNHVDGYELDKDFIGNGKLYSPENCIYMPNWLNSFLTNCNNKGVCLTGVHKVRNKYRAECQNQVTGIREHLGYFHYEEEAHIAWKNFKLHLAEQRKDEFDNIHIELYDYIINKIKNV